MVRYFTLSHADRGISQLLKSPGYLKITSANAKAIGHEEASRSSSREQGADSEEKEREEKKTEML